MLTLKITSTWYLFPLLCWCPANRLPLCRGMVGNPGCFPTPSSSGQSPFANSPGIFVTVHNHMPGACRHKYNVHAVLSPCRERMYFYQQNSSSDPLQWLTLGHKSVSLLVSCVRLAAVWLQLKRFTSSPVSLIIAHHITLPWIRS